MTNNDWNTGICFLLGVPMAAGGGWLAVRTWRLSRTGVRIQAEVVSFTGINSDTGMPIVTFTDDAGTRHQLTLPVGGGREQVGDRMTVVYPPGRPREARSATSFQLWLPAAGLLVAGFVCLWAACSLARL